MEEKISNRNCGRKIRKKKQSRLELWKKWKKKIPNRISGRKRNKEMESGDLRRGQSKKRETCSGTAVGLAATENGAAEKKERNKEGKKRIRRKWKRSKL